MTTNNLISVFKDTQKIFSEDLKLQQQTLQAQYSSQLYLEG